MLKLKLIGVGGIGTNLLSFLPRYLAYQQKEGVELTLVDGKVFLANNIARQSFLSQGNKAEVKAKELRKEFPSLTVLAVPEYVTVKNIRWLVENNDVVLLAVDNNATRLLVSRRCQRLANIMLISGGNDLETGSVQVYIRRNRKNLTNSIEKIHPEMVIVMCGTREASGRYAGRTVASVRQEFAEYLKVPAGAVAVLGGKIVSPGEEARTIIPQAGQVEFVQRTGPKG